ncbi:Ribosome bioproteinsis protein erb1 [Venturia inaequalis]|uniref:Ribosome biogenesis protein ERB1 n=2 Tax=Venturia inaequalis TaxID=5025 RepID=A0A8H3YXI1_VENIN|nr:Ribosome bioproteinsis protein erb1 [Venturia inaequalis]
MDPCPTFFLFLRLARAQEGTTEQQELTIMSQSLLNKKRKRPAGLPNAAATSSSIGEVVAVVGELVNLGDGSQGRFESLKGWGKLSNVPDDRVDSSIRAINPSDCDRDDAGEVRHGGPKLDGDEAQAGAERVVRGGLREEGGGDGSGTSLQAAMHTMAMDEDPDDEDMVPDLEGDDEELRPNYTVTTDANGNTRYIYKEIDPVYDSDDSDAQEATNTIGDIPLSFYDSYPHIGYDIDGKKIMRPATGKALDALLDSIDIPKGWTGLTDPATGKPLNLSRDELEVLKRITRNEVPEDGYDPYPDMVEYFTSHEEIMPLSAAPEPKRRFVPSKHEAKRVMKIVRAIREGRIQPYKPPAEQEEEEEDVINYDIWADEKPRPDHVMNIPAPKLPPPGYEDSYHPPPEYLPDKNEKAQWEATDPEDRDKEYLPTDYGALRKVPGYDNVKLTFERCLDLYLAPRVRRSKLNIDPESLLPKLPSPDELRPFPTVCANIFREHSSRARSVAVDPTGTHVASGGDDGYVRVWEIDTGRQVWSKRLSSEDAVDVVTWRPSLDTVILAAAVQENIYFIIPYGLSMVNPEMEVASREVIDAGFGYQTHGNKTNANENINKEPSARWARPEQDFVDDGVLLTATVRSPIKVVAWHRRGDYFSTVSPKGQSHAVAIHTLSKHLTQLPFRKLKGLPQTAQFHPSKPIFFVATQRGVRSYDLSQQKLVKILQPGARWISSMDIHPGGDNLIVGSYDRRLLWHDLDLSSKPYKTLRYHEKAIRAVKFHQGGLPLFADASDDGSLQIFHGKVVGDLMENATIVPLKVLKGHQVKGALGVLGLDWHPKHPWAVSAGADGSCRVWC